MSYMDIAKIILGQLDGNRFITMTGAKHFVGIADPGLQFDFPVSIGVLIRIHSGMLVIL